MGCVHSATVREAAGTGGTSNPLDQQRSAPIVDVEEQKGQVADEGTQGDEGMHLDGAPMQKDPSLRTSLEQVQVDEQPAHASVADGDPNRRVRLNIPARDWCSRKYDPEQYWKKLESNAGEAAGGSGGGKEGDEGGDDNDADSNASTADGSLKLDFSTGRASLRGLGGGGRNEGSLGAAVAMMATDS